MPVLEFSDSQVSLILIAKDCSMRLSMGQTSLHRTLTTCGLPLELDVVGRDTVDGSVINVTICRSFGATGW